MPDNRTSSPTLTNVPTVRRATPDDLPGLLGLELQFSEERMSRRSLRRLLRSLSAELWVAEQDGRILGDAVVLFRRGLKSARLYSLVVDSAARGRGIGGALLAAVEAAARRRGCVGLRLEVREDNRAAQALYRRDGFEEVARLEGYYADGCAALRMRKRLVSGTPLLIDVPFYRQTLDFTCGPAALMMALRTLGFSEPLDRALEVALWREATTVFMLSGHGGCSAFGLAVAALQRGFGVRVVSDGGVPFLDSVRIPDKKEVIRLVHEGFLGQIAELGGIVEVGTVDVDGVGRALAEGGVPLLLISGYRFYGEKVPHWVVVTGFDDEHLYLNDPYVVPGSPFADGVDLPLPISSFAAVARFGKARHRSMLVVYPRSAAR